MKVVALPNGGFGLVSSALFEGDSDGNESVALVSGDTYPTYEAAETAGLMWADEQGVETLYVGELEQIGRCLRREDRTALALRRHAKVRKNADPEGHQRFLK